MATATMATAAGAAALLYYTLNRKIQGSDPHDDEMDGDAASAGHDHVGIERISNRLVQAPATWLETISTLSETLRFTYSETLGKWPIADLAFGINFLLKRQGILRVCDVFGGEDCVQVTNRDMIPELRYLMKLLTLCWYFSKKSFPVFLKENGYSEENVLLHQPKPGILKPAFTILVDHDDKRIILLIRGTHSIKVTLTAVTGAVVPFHHTVLPRWIAKLSKPCLLKALGGASRLQNPYNGTLFGGGTAALVTFILREQKELSRATCYTFASAACMTWELAESGNEFITSIINGADIVPTFSAASMDDLRVEVFIYLCPCYCICLINDLRNQIERTRILSTVYRSASALVSRLPSIATTKATVAGAGAILRPVSSGTQVVMRRAQSMAQAGLDTENGGDDLNSPGQSEGRMTEVELWHQLENELYNRTDGEELDLAKEIREDEEVEEEEEEAIAMAEVGVEGEGNSSQSEKKEVHRFFPPGRTLHLVTLPRDSESDSLSALDDGIDPRVGMLHPPSLDSPTLGDIGEDGPRVGLFYTPRSLYSKIRLSQTMIRDHFMPIYRRQIDRVIKELEREDDYEDHQDYSAESSSSSS
ncbi:hypothetical protein MLD38_029498 [Melastoma candidum]|uniref:Uncharacterized protein n=1 Tax=Melastoma candidum TaxID=119954 RepID=A0ACB9N3Y2_9MYRT|nr:hypothetical protein MLD38_029498 [Melastoma candidum]